jgi:hypothetical protein
LPVDGLPPEVAADLRGRFDCDRGLPAGELLICPRR